MRLAGKPLIVILGPTGVGKTQLAIQIAREFNGEIIGADSRQIYRYMDIGTAKPTPEQTALVPHHLINVVEPDDNLTLAEYQEQAYAAIDSLHEKGKLPLLVGGTGQYITAVVEGWSIPRVPPNFELRAEYEAFAEEHGADALHARLKAVDPDSAAKIHPNNVRRVVRALEVYDESGTPISELQRKRKPPYRIMTIGLNMPREALYERVDRRVDAMIEQGFVDEVRDLLQRGYARELPSMSGIGYLEIAAYLADEYPLEDAIQKTYSSTHEFIRKQDVWFRGHDHGILWHNVLELDEAQLLADIRDWLRGLS